MAYLQDGAGGLAVQRFPRRSWMNRPKQRWIRCRVFKSRLFFEFVLRYSG